VGGSRGFKTTQKKLSSLSNLLLTWVNFNSGASSLNVLSSLEKSDYRDLANAVDAGQDSRQAI
jgi:hypothetical protein